MAMYQPTRSPYGIKEPGSPPRPVPWWARKLGELGGRMTAVRQRYEQQSTSGQIVGAVRGHTRDDYATRLQAQWRSGGTRGSRADPITEAYAAPPPARQWPGGAPGGAWTPSDRNRRMDPRPAFLGHMGGAYLPRDEAYTVYGAQFEPRSRRYYSDYLPFRIGPPTMPFRIVRPHRWGLALMAGSEQFGTRQTYGQGPDSLVVAPPQFSRTGQGVRSVGGVLAPKQGTGRERIPAVFNPSSVQ